ncbi:ABC transporter ATP-binding protein [Chryseotalea sanaruensis]|uniref:ABC transporter ATP-binding protein n=1 Tax=Chryseotalea sanaruensis TaxID=2482724 RepID=A0A401UEA4_9BACT|nr:ABC transporter ATP-binding protein [Chryseotalea sanaruensis]GCC53229.1 ABC transporter ATP-binding protein [Chryseotalea sanaruensis]
MYQYWLRFFGLLRKHLFGGFVLLIMLIIGNLGALASPYFLKVIIDKVFGEGDFQLLIQIVFSLLGLYVLRVGANFYADYLYTKISNKITQELTEKLFSHMLKLPMFYFKVNSVGSLVYKINNEVSQVRRAFTGSIISMINSIITIVGLTVLMVLLNLELFIIICLLYPLLILITKYFTPSIKTIIENTRKEESDFLAFLTERFSNVKFIKLFYSHEYEGFLMKNRINRIIDLNLKSTILTSGSNNLSVLLLAFIPLVVLVYGGKQVLESIITVGTLIAFLQYANKLHEPFRNIVSLYVDLVKTSVSIKRIYDVLDEPIDLESASDELIEMGEICEIKFEDVSFAFNDKQVLNKINVIFEAGKKYALVGKSGSGKSTLIDLLCKLIKEDSGSILVNNIRLNEIKTKHWIEKLAVCSQDYFILNGTLYDNLHYGNSSVNKSEIDAILDQMGLSSDDSDTFSSKTLGETGSTISGGQRQKIAIARALLRNPEILIIDEATSELDSLSEQKVFEYINNQPTIRLVIIISHRLSSIQFADEIILLDEGKASEVNSIKEHISMKGGFYKLFKNQLVNSEVARDM